MSLWRKWFEHPEKLWLHKLLFQIHYLLGASASAYVLLLSVSGSAIVYRNELSSRFSIEWLVKLHEDLLSGHSGRFANGIGAVALTSICLSGAAIWWPGIRNWRRSLSVTRGLSFARLNWDLNLCVCSTILGETKCNRI